MLKKDYNGTRQIATSRRMILGAELTATAVPGRKSIVKTAMVRIAALSRLVASAICRALLAICRLA
jgi:hypothetical protein